MKTWAMKYDNCKECSTSDKPHKGDGLCTTCYYKQYQRKKPTQRTNELERFAKDLPLLLRKIGINLAVNYKDGTITLKKHGTKLSASWPD